MKLRWWLIGAAAAVSAGIFLLKQMNSDGDDMRLPAEESKRSSGDCKPEDASPEFDEIDFLA
jgi:hypothetical protein